MRPTPNVMMRRANSFRSRPDSIPRAILAFAFATALHAAAPCPLPRDVQPGVSLESLAAFYLGSSRYAIAIALATNERTGDNFPYIANPDDLTGIPRVCVPSKPE